MNFQYIVLLIAFISCTQISCQCLTRGQACKTVDQCCGKTGNCGIKNGVQNAGICQSSKGQRCDDHEQCALVPASYSGTSRGKCGTDRKCQ